MKVGCIQLDLGNFTVWPHQLTCHASISFTRHQVHCYFIGWIYLLILIQVFWLSLMPCCLFVSCIYPLLQHSEDTGDEVSLWKSCLTWSLGLSNYWKYTMEETLACLLVNLGKVQNMLSKKAYYHTYKILVESHCCINIVWNGFSSISKSMLLYIFIGAEYK